MFNQQTVRYSETGNYLTDYPNPPEKRLNTHSSYAARSDMQKNQHKNFEPDNHIILILALMALIIFEHQAAEKN